MRQLFRLRLARRLRGRPKRPARHDPREPTSAFRFESCGGGKDENGPGGDLWVDSCSIETQLLAQGADPASTDACCGLSLGEYTALVHAGAMSFEDGVRLVKARGEAMQLARYVGNERERRRGGEDGEVSLEKSAGKLNPLNSVFTVRCHPVAWLASLVYQVRSNINDAIVSIHVVIQRGGGCTTLQNRRCRDWTGDHHC